MSILENLLAAIIELNATIKATTGLAPVSDVDAKSQAGTKKSGSTKKEEPEGPTREEVVALMSEVKEKFDVATAKSLVKKFGKADKLVDAADSTLAALFKAATAKMAEEVDEGV